jgi:hypothetical protein
MNQKRGLEQEESEHSQKSNMEQVFETEVQSGDTFEFSFF